MKRLLKASTYVLLAFIFTLACIAGPEVVPNPKSPAVKVWDNNFVVVQEFKDPETIQMIQGIFLRSRRVGDTNSHLKTPTHKIDFSDRWLFDIESGEIGVLSKAVVDVHQVDPADLKSLKRLIENKAQAAAENP